MAMTPLFYHPDQDVVFDFISTKKVPEFVRQSQRRYHIPQLLTAEAFYPVHERSYVDGVIAGTIPNGFANRNADVNRSIIASNSNFLAAAHHAMDHGLAASATQGFHHAHHGEGYGYCTFNGLMLAALDLKARGRVERVLIIDGDGHHGDGTDDIIAANPGCGVVNITSATMHGLVDEFDASQWRDYTADLIREYRPGIIMYQAGADAWDLDPYGVGYLDELGLMRRDQGIMTAAKVAEVPLVWNLAGGYSTPMQKVIDLHLNTLMMSDRVYYGNSGNS